MVKILLDLYLYSIMALNILFKWIFHLRNKAHVKFPPHCFYFSGLHLLFCYELQFIYKSSLLLWLSAITMFMYVYSLHAIFPLIYIIYTYQGLKNIPDFDAKSITYPLFAILQISWIRLRDWHILTNGVVTYTTDSRFQVNCDI